MLRLSYSKYALFKKCPLYYRYATTIPLEIPPNADALIGNRLHNEFYKIMKGKIKKDAQEIWEEIKKNHVLVDAHSLRDNFESFKDMQNYYSSLKNVIIMWRSEEEYIEKIKSALVNSRKIVENMDFRDYKIEKWYQENIDNFSIFGRFDMVSDTEIIDLKTGRKTEENEEQILFYSLIFFLRKGIIPETKIIYLTSGDIESFKISYGKLWKFRKNLSCMVNKILKGEFSPTPGPHCRFCPYRFICEY